MGFRFFALRSQTPRPAESLAVGAARLGSGSQPCLQRVKLAGPSSGPCWARGASAETREHALSAREQLSRLARYRGLRIMEAPTPSIAARLLEQRAGGMSARPN